MSNYTIVTNFLSKDSLVSGNALKALKGAELTTEFTAVQTAINSKFDGAVTFAPDGSAVQPSFGFTNSSGTGMYNAAGVLNFATAATQRMSINAAGAITMNAATSATTLSLTGASGQVAAQFTGVGASSFGLVVSGANVAGAIGADIRGGTSSADWALIVRNAAASILWNFSGDGGFYTSGLSSLGFGSVNAASLAVSGSPVYAGIPQNSIAGTSYTLILSDANKHVYMPNTSAKTLVIPANASVTYPVGTAITIVNGGLGSIALSITTDQLVWSPPGSVGSRTIAPFGVVSILKTASGSWVLTGSGIS